MSSEEPAGDDAVEVVDVPERGRFELREKGRLIGIAMYAVVPGEAQASPPVADRVVFFHTEIRPEHGGRGLASRLAAEALDATVRSGRTIVAVCPYIRAFVGRHRETYAAHVSRPTDADLDAVDRATGSNTD